MKTIALGLVLLAVQATAAVIVPMKLEWPVVKRTAVITLQVEPIRFVAPLPERTTPPVTVTERTQVTLKPVSGEGDIITVSWQKDGKTIANSPELVLNSATAADSGRYTAHVTATDAQGGTRSYITNTAALLVTSEGPRVYNTSTRVRLSPGAGSVLHGFVIEPTPNRLLLLVRGVGPALRKYGVDDALAAPALRLFDAAGQLIAPAPEVTEDFTTLPTLEEASRRAGAFPLETGDVARLYYVSGGAYTAELRAADGGSGTALVEIYAVPLDPPASYPWWQHE